MTHPAKMTIHSPTVNEIRGRRRDCLDKRDLHKRRAAGFLDPGADQSGARQPDEPDRAGKAELYGTRSPARSPKAVSALVFGLR